MGRLCSGGPRGISRGSLVVDGRRGGGDRRARRSEVLPRRGEVRTRLRRAGSLPGGRLLPRRGLRSGCPAHSDPGRCRACRLDGRRRLRSVGRGGRRRHRSQEGPGSGGRERAAVRRGHRQRPEDLVTGRRASSRHLGCAGRSPGQGHRRERRLGRPARDHPGGTARSPGAGAGREDRSSRDPALHVASR